MNSLYFVVLVLSSLHQFVNRIPSFWDNESSRYAVRLLRVIRATATTSINARVRDSILSPPLLGVLLLKATLYYTTHIPKVNTFRAIHLR